MIVRRFVPSALCGPFSKPYITAEPNNDVRASGRNQSPVGVQTSDTSNSVPDIESVSASVNFNGSGNQWLRQQEGQVLIIFLRRLQQGSK